ncbi:MAG: restriction endonuclease subunit S [Brevundimonas sp.]
MSAERLLLHYERIANAPDGIAHLRGFILDLAVRGKLVPQDATDEPASELLTRIAKEKARLVKAKEIRAPKELAPLDDREFLFAVPNGWAVAPLDGLSPRSLSDGDWIETKDQSEDGGVRLIQLADVGVGEFLNKSARYVTEETEIRLNCTRLAVGDLLIARLPHPIGRACIFPDIGQPAITAVDVAILRPDSNVSAEFLVLAMNAPPIREQIEAYGKGATRFRVSTGHLKTVQIPLPPLAEQQRIVAKVAELMGLCGQLEAARAGREGVRDQLTAASLARLNAPDPETFQADARFALDALPALSTRPDQIKALRQTILNLAVRGRLVEQDPADEPASALLERIALEKARLVRNGKARKSEIGPMVLDDAPFRIPPLWAWTRLGSVADWGAGSTPPRGNPDLYGPGLTWLKSGELNDNRALAGSSETVTLLAVKTGSFRRNKPGDILVAMYGATIGKVAILAEEAVTNQAVCGCTPFEGLSNQFLFLFLLAQREQFRSASEGGAQPNISKEKIVGTPFPLPPLAEQHRIVAKVDQLMRLCDGLEGGLKGTSTIRLRLLDALLHEALNPVPLDEVA